MLSIKNKQYLKHTLFLGMNQNKSTIFGSTKTTIGLIIFLIGIFINEYKFGIMIRCLENNTPYYIFPWSSESDRQLSSSSPYWLILHLFFSLIHVGVSFLTIISYYGNFEKIYRKMIKSIYNTSYFIFAMLIVFNLNHFGEAPTIKAVVMNGLPLLIAHLCYVYNFYFGHFLAITSPIIFEFVLNFKYNTEKV